MLTIADGYSRFIKPILDRKSPYEIATTKVNKLLANANINYFSQILGQPVFINRYSVKDRQIIENITAKNVASPVPVVLFTKAGGQWLELMAQSGCDVIPVSPSMMP